MNEPRRYKTRPQHLEAMEITEANIAFVAAWAGGNLHRHTRQHHDLIVLRTPSGNQTASVGDFVVKIRPNEVHVMDRTTFDRLYEEE